MLQADKATEHEFSSTYMAAKFIAIFLNSTSEYLDQMAWYPQ